MAAIRQLHRETIAGKAVIRILLDHLLQHLQAVGAHDSETYSDSDDVNSRTWRAALSTTPAALEVVCRALLAASPKRCCARPATSPNNAAAPSTCSRPFWKASSARRNDQVAAAGITRASPAAANPHPTPISTAPIIPDLEFLSIIPPG